MKSSSSRTAETASAQAQTQQHTKSHNFIVDGTSLGAGVLPQRQWDCDFILCNMANLTPSEIRAKEHEEELMRSNPSRWVILPINYNEIWDGFKKLEESFWTPEDVTFLHDGKNVAALPQDLQVVLREVAAFNAISYRKVYDVEAATLDQLCAIQSPEARAFYGFQIAYENFHIEVFNLAFEALMGDQPDMTQMCHAVYSKPSVAKKKEWYDTHVLDPLKPFCEKTFAIGLMKQLFSSANILLRGWISSRNLELPGLAGGYRLVGRDLHIHTEFCSIIYNSLENKLRKEDVEAMVAEAIECETKFLEELIPLGVLELTEDQRRDYVKWLADEVLLEMKLEKMFDFKKCPISYVDIAQDKIPKSTEGDKGRGTARQSAQEQMNLLEKWRSGVKSGLSPEEAREALFSLDADF